MQGIPRRRSVRHRVRHGAAIAAALLLAGCSSVPTAPPVPAGAKRDAAPPATPMAKPAPALPAAGSGRGGYYLDDGPGDNPPGNLLAVPDAEPKIEPNYVRNNKPYVVFGKTYTPIAPDAPLKQRGIASWYGKKFHGQKTSSGELYDMYKMTGAHPTIPLPSYVRVTNLANGKQVIVRINDRGPFHSNRIMDLSYTAALKLGYIGHGSSEIEIERLLPDEIARMEKDRLGERAVPLVETARVPAVLPALEVKTLAAGPTIVPARASGPLPAMAPVVVAQADTAVIPPPMTSGTALMMELPASAGVPAALPALVDTALSGSVAATTPAAVGAAGFYLQLGAFSQAPNAQAARLRLQRDIADALPPTEVVQTGLVFRLYSGPFTSRTEAALAAQKMQDAGGPKPFIVQR